MLYVVCHLSSLSQLGVLLILFFFFQFFSSSHVPLVFYRETRVTELVTCLLLRVIFYLTRINCRFPLIYFLIIWSLLFLLLQLPFLLNRLVYRRHLSPFCSLSSFKNINKLNPKARATTSITRTIWTRKKKATVQTAKLWQMSLYEVESRRVAFGIEAKSRTWEHAWRFAASQRHVM